jgi:ABC-type multidrug transport system ATPase subunit
MSPSVHVRALKKSNGTFEAVKGVDFEIFPGEVFGLLGPNGAGKTTTVGDPRGAAAAERRRGVGSR